MEDGDVLQPFSARNGVQQGCVLAPTLLCLLFTEMFSAALYKTNAGMKIKFRTNGHFFCLQCMKASTKVKEAQVHISLFANDCICCSH